MLWGRDSEAGRPGKNSVCNVDKRTGKTERDPEMQSACSLGGVTADKKR